MAQQVKCWSTDLVVPGMRLLVAEIFPIVNEAQLHAAVHYHPTIILLLKYC